ncbi:uncharacterized protein KGF55_002848 [Candida pseudojiufengensis]|uniref:uncharacterized protein n=1 Tax=Candida pseudojiufengensis TaxID=497109 RepID=UPI00222424F7|nr:uncharacterized protein KGF55_002848 [Candida pseudojiufengensis]KAI5963056.1 hypothetical protein KGF55_002848 [Candida pseudojiufengensis]
MSQPEYIEIRALGDTKLFEPIQVGPNTLNQRIAFAPTTRRRATSDHVPVDLELDYYTKRAQAPGTLIITEATFVSPQGSGSNYVPGIFTKEQVKGWKKINDSIHKEKSFSSIQLWYLGRAAEPAVLKKDGLPFLGPSAIYKTEESEKAAKESGNELRPFTIEEINRLVNEEYPNAARNALEAGFDYFELHAAHSYAISQFFNPASNKRTDKYGGSIENRARILLEIIDKLIPIVGANRLAVRLSPWATFQTSEPEGEEIHSYILKELQKRSDQGNELAYISIVEPRVSGSLDVEKDKQIGSNEFANKIWKGKFIKAGNYTYDAPDFKSLLEDVQDNRTLIGFSRFFTSNPDLVSRLKNGYPLLKYDRAVFYDQDNWGYNTYNNYDEQKTFDENRERNRYGLALA